MRNWCKKTIDWLFDKSNFALATLGGAFSIIDISGIDDWTIGELNFPIGKVFYWSFCFLFVIFCIISYSYGKEIDKIENENNSLKQEVNNKSLKISELENKVDDIINETNDLFNSYLKLMVKNLNFTHTERISVYKVYNDKFKLIGRTSENPRLEEKGRSEYPIGEGFIGKGWEEGEFFINDLPCPETDFDEYVNQINKICDISKSALESMKMKSRTFFIYRIKGNDNKPKAVLVFESKKEKGFEKQNVIDRLKDVKQPLVIFIEKNNGVTLVENNLGI